MLRSAGVVMLLGISAQVVAFLRTAVIAALFGASLDVDAYNLGLIAPIFASNVIGAWLQVAFVGRYTELLTHGSREHAAAYRGGMLVLVLVGALSLTGLCLLLPRQVMGLFMPAWRPDILTSAAAALQPAALILVPTAIGDFLSLVMNAHRRFFLAAAAPLANALVSIAGLLTWSSPDLAALVWTLLAGSVTQCLVVGAAVYWLRLPFPIWRGNVGVDMRRAVLLALPMLPSAMLVNATAPILQFSAARLGEGAVAIYGYASRLHGSISQILLLGLSTVLLPHFAALWSRGQKDEIILLFRRLARCTLLVVAYLTVGIFLTGETATRVLFQRGAFDAPQTTQVSAAWFILSLSLFPYVFGTFIAKFCQAISDARSLLASSVILFASTWLAGWYGASIGTVGGVAAAYTASFVVMGFYWFPWLSRRIHSRIILRDIAISLFRCALILAPAVAVDRWFPPFTDSPVVDLVSHGTIYSLTCLLLFVATRSYIWFLARNPS
jgi:putative peptidoglycan lipid II flippase